MLLVKPQFLNIAREVFADTEVRVTADGHRHLGAVLGTEQYCNQYVAQKAEQWCKEVKRLATHALSQPQAAYTAFSQGLKHKWSFLVRTVPGAADLLQPLEDVIRNDFIPALTGRHPPNSAIRAVLDLPCRLGIVDPSQLSDEHQRSLSITHPLIDNIIQQQSSMEGISGRMRVLKATARTAAGKKEKDHVVTLMAQLD